MSMEEEGKDMAVAGGGGLNSRRFGRRMGTRSAMFEDSAAGMEEEGEKMSEEGTTAGCKYQAAGMEEEEGGMLVGTHRNRGEVSDRWRGVWE